MQSDTTPGLTQGVPGAPDDGHETAFLNVEKHRSSLELANIVLTPF